MELLPQTCHGPGSVIVEVMGHWGTPKLLICPCVSFAARAIWGCTARLPSSSQSSLQLYTDMSPAVREGPSRLCPRCASVCACPPVRTHQSRASWSLTNPKAPAVKLFPYHLQYRKWTPEPELHGLGLSCPCWSTALDGPGGWRKQRFSFANKWGFTQSITLPPPHPNTNHSLPAAAHSLRILKRKRKKRDGPPRAA